MEEIMEAIRLMEDNQQEEAIAKLESCLSDADDEEKMTIAELYQQWGYVKQAIDILESLRQAYPDESELSVMLADMYIEMENDDTAIERLNDIGQDDEAYLQSLVQLADLYQAQGLFEVAEQKLLTAKQNEPNEIVIDFALGELYFSVGEYLKAITYYQNVLPEAETLAETSIPQRLAEAHAASGAYEEALELYQQIEPEHPDTLFKYGLTAFQSGRNDIAINAWKKTLELDIYYHTAYYYLSEAYEDEDMHEEALTTAKQGLEVDEYNPQLYFLTGKLSHKSGNNDDSEHYLRQAIALDPDYKEAILYLIEMFKETDGQDAIIELLQEVMGAEITDGVYNWELGRAYYEIESFDDALKHYADAYNTLNKDSDFLKEYAYFLVEEGRMETAIEMFNAYLALQPLDTETEAYVSRLKDGH